VSDACGSLFSAEAEHCISDLVAGVTIVWPDQYTALELTEDVTKLFREQLPALSCQCGRVSVLIVLERDQQAQFTNEELLTPQCGVGRSEACGYLREQPSVRLDVRTEMSGLLVDSSPGSPLEPEVVEDANRGRGPTLRTEQVDDQRGVHFRVDGDPIARNVVAAEDNLGDVRGEKLGNTSLLINRGCRAPL
jgi:hypothetical protein